MNKTAVEWLEQKAKEFAIDLNLLHYFEQAKEMEKQQIIDAYDYSYGVASFKTGTTSEQYYNKTFNK
jgi:hypothetical protein